MMKTMLKGFLILNSLITAAGDRGGNGVPLS